MSLNYFIEKTIVHVTNLKEKLHRNNLQLGESTLAWTKNDG